MKSLQSQKSNKRKSGETPSSPQPSQSLTLQTSSQKSTYPKIWAAYYHATTLRSLYSATAVWSFNVRSR